jgi:signal transduction histidine kinase
MVETLLLVARYESGEASTMREPIDCGELLTGITAELRPVTEMKGIDLRVEVPKTPLLTVADPHEIRRAVVNLLANAIDATPRGGHVTAAAARDGNFIVTTIEDDGYGVPAEQRETLFQRFGGGYHGAGTGLGLYIVRRIAEKHGGTVRYEPREPRGSSFTMTLPVLAS